MMSDRAASSRTSIAGYALAVLIFGLLAASGLDMFRNQVPALAAPFLLAGVAGVAGTVVTAVAVHWRPNVRVQRAAQAGMAVAAVAVAGVGVAVAPADAERSFAITVAALLAFLLAVFALVAAPPSK
jgi:hypothetical protein